MQEPDWADAYLKVSCGFLNTSNRNLQASCYALYVQSFFLKQWPKTKLALDSHVARVHEATRQVELIAEHAREDAASEEEILLAEMLDSEQAVLFELIDELIEAVAFYDPEKRVAYEGVRNAARIVAVRAEVDSFLNDTLTLALMRQGMRGAAARKTARGSLSKGLLFALQRFRSAGIPVVMSKSEARLFGTANRLRNTIAHGGGRLEVHADDSVEYREAEFPHVDYLRLMRTEASFLLPIRAVNRAYSSVLTLTDEQRELLEELDVHLEEQTAVLRE